jgi:hypothetical protein
MDTKTKLCGCGCGSPIPESTSFISGHWSRTAEAQRGYRERRMHIEPASPDGLCRCGCGQTTPIAKTDKPERGYRKGDHIAYVRGHQVKTGPNNPAWKGGIVTRYGYAYVLVPDHPHADRDGYVAEHRLVAGVREGRILERHEHVHHINGDTFDNRPENLQILTKAEHHQLHRESLNNWYASLSPDERRAQRQAAGRLGAVARWNRTKP